jgi:RNA polymerase sigma factor (sigma-70 family)
MDFFFEHLKGIQQMARKICRSYHGKYEVDELINVAWMDYQVMIEKYPFWTRSYRYPELILYKRVRYDMLNYIRYDLKLKKKKILEKNGSHVPLFISYNAEDKDGEKLSSFTGSYSDKGFDKVDNLELLEYLRTRMGLTDREWKILKYYFYNGYTDRLIAEKINISKSRVSQLRNQALKKCKEHLIGV